MKGGSAFAAKLRSKAREALLASRTSYSNFQDARKMQIEKKEELSKTIDVNPCIQLAVDLPGMSFITLFCDDQKVRSNNSEIVTIPLLKIKLLYRLLEDASSSQQPSTAHKLLKDNIFKQLLNMHQI